jgi:hypothetical protein
MCVPVVSLIPYKLNNKISFDLKKLVVEFFKGAAPYIKPVHLSSPSIALSEILPWEEEFFKANSLIVSSNFSQIRGTPKNQVGLAHVSV